MTEKLKYKVGDKVLVEAKFTQVDSGNFPYYLESLSGNFMGWHSTMSIESSVINLPPKPKVTQAMMDWYEKHKNERVSWDIRDWLHGLDEFEETNDWALTGEVTDLDRQHALATLIAYGPEAVEVEKEKMYRVYLVGVKNQWNQRQCLTNNEDNYFFSGRCMVDTTYTKQEIIKAGFGDVFDNPMFEVEEVE